MICVLLSGNFPDACFPLTLQRGSAETEPSVAPCGSRADMCLSAVWCTAVPSTEVSEVFASKQEKQTVRSKGQEVASPRKRERNWIACLTRPAVAVHNWIYKGFFRLGIGHSCGKIMENNLLIMYFRFILSYQHYQEKFNLADSFQNNHFTYEFILKKSSVR